MSISYTIAFWVSLYQTKRFVNTVVGDNINIMKTTFELNFD